MSGSVQDRLLSAFAAVGLDIKSLFARTANVSPAGIDLFDGATRRSQLVLVEGDTWLLANAYWDPATAEFYRVDRTKASFGIQVQGKNYIPGEAELGYFVSGLTQWVAQPASYDMIKTGGVSTGNRYTGIGSWLLGSTLTQERGFTLGGAGIEVDGYGTLPYGRLQHATVGSSRRTGVLVNAYLDESGRDDTASPSWSFGVDQTDAGESFKIRYAPGNGAGLAWQDIFSINSAGVFSGVALDGKANTDGSNAFGDWAVRSKSTKVIDNRGVTPTPVDVVGYEVGYQFKAVAEVGNPPVSATPAFAWIQTIAGWSADGSGGWPIQLSWGSTGYAIRQALSGTTWGPWSDTTVTSGPTPTTIPKRVTNISVTGAATINWSLYDEVRLTLVGNSTLTFTAPSDGQTCVLKVKQDATGGRTLTLPSNVRYGTDLPSYTASSTATKFDRIGFIYDATDAKFDLVSAIKGF